MHQKPFPIILRTAGLRLKRLPEDKPVKSSAKNAPAPQTDKDFLPGKPSRQRQAAEQQASQRLPRLVITDLSQKKESSSVLGKLPQQQSKPSALTYLPSGTFAKARPLNGTIAPTRGQGSGKPCSNLNGALTDAAVMPNLYRSGIKRCFVTANATGELASERVLIRLDRLSCIDENGGAVDTKLQGYVSGEDGKTGLRARLVTNRTGNRQCTLYRNLYRALAKPSL